MERTKLLRIDSYSLYVPPYKSYGTYKRFLYCYVTNLFSICPNNRWFPDRDSVHLSLCQCHCLLPIIENSYDRAILPGYK